MWDEYWTHRVLPTIEFLPHQEFQKCVARYSGGRYLKNLSCWDQYLAMAFAQLTYRESLRDIEACLRSVSGKLYHLGFRGKVAQSGVGRVIGLDMREDVPARATQKISGMKNATVSTTIRTNPRLCATNKRFEGRDLAASWGTVDFFSFP
jgi:hypothetical protein